MKYIGFDFGTKRIGVAVGQDITRQATPLCILTAKHGQPQWQEIDALVKSWCPAAFIIGIPYNTDYPDNATSQRAKNFGQALKKRYSLDVHEIDEHLTTVEAKSRLKAKGTTLKSNVDSVAACILLENWLQRSNDE